MRGKQVHRMDTNNFIFLISKQESAWKSAHKTGTPWHIDIFNSIFILFAWKARRWYLTLERSARWKFLLFFLEFDFKFIIGERGQLKNFRFCLFSRNHLFTHGTGPRNVKRQLFFLTIYSPLKCDDEVLLFIGHLNFFSFLNTPSSWTPVSNLIRLQEFFIAQSHVIFISQKSGWHSCSCWKLSERGEYRCKPCMSLSFPRAGHAIVKINSLLW